MVEDQEFKMCISWHRFIDFFSRKKPFVFVPTHSQLRGTGGFGNKDTHLLDLTVNWTIIFGFRYLSLETDQICLFII